MDGHIIRIDFGFNYSRSPHIFMPGQRFAHGHLFIMASKIQVSVPKERQNGRLRGKSFDETSASSKTKKNNERLWTDEEPEQLITTYDGRKCLWDFTSKQCSERDQKPLAFNSIDEKMSQVKSFEEPIHERSCITTITTLTSTSPCCDRQVCKKKCYRLDPSPLAKVRAKVKVRTHPRCFQKFLYIF